MDAAPLSIVPGLNPAAALHASTGLQSIFAPAPLSVTAAFKHPAGTQSLGTSAPLSQGDLHTSQQEVYLEILNLDLVQ